MNLSHSHAPSTGDRLIGVANSEKSPTTITLDDCCLGPADFTCELTAGLRPLATC